MSKIGTNTFTNAYIGNNEIYKMLSGSNVVFLPYLLQQVPGWDVLLMPDRKLSTRIIDSQKVLRDTDNVEQSFSPRDAEDGTIEAFLDGDDGFCSELVNWAGKAPNATQANKAAMPIRATDGVLETGLRFAGAQVMELGTGNIGTTQLTVCGWAKVAATVDFVFAGKFAATGNLRSWTVHNLSGKLRGAVSADGVSVVGLSSDTDIPLNEWFFFALRFDAGNLRWYLNGELDVETTSETITSIYQSTRAIRLGSGTASAANHTGNIAFCGISPRALTEAEINTTMQLTDPT
jgi:hypothetical protein